MGTVNWTEFLLVGPSRPASKISDCKKTCPSGEVGRAAIDPGRSCGLADLGGTVRSLRSKDYSMDASAGRRESDRIKALRRLNILDSPPEERFDRLTRLARRLFDAPIALVSLVDSNRQWFKSNEGLEVRETPLEWSFCSHAVSEREMLVVPDTLADERFQENPLVLGDPSIRFYAGQPILEPRGSAIGTLCIIDREPREMSEEDRTLLSDMANLVEREFAALRLATIDELTGLSNLRGFKMLSRQALAMCRRMKRPATLLSFDLDGFKAINDTFGHAAGDAALASFSADLLANFRDSDVVARLGGDEFCVLLSGASAKEMPVTLDKLATIISKRNEGRDEVAHLRYSVGAVAFDPEVHESASELLKEADALMYENKRRER